MEKKLMYLGTKLPILAQKRQQKIFAWKAENLITREEFIRYGKSEFIRGVQPDLDAFLVQGKKLWTLPWTILLWTVWLLLFIIIILKNK